MSQQRIFLLFTIGIVGLVFLGCVILGVTIYINLPAWLPPQATTSSGLSNPGNVTRPAQAPWHLQLPPTESATPPATLTHQPEKAAPLPTHTQAPVTLPANATLLPTQPPQSVATLMPAQSPTRTPGLPTIGAKPPGTPSPPTPTASAVISPVATGTARPTTSSTSTPTAQAANTPTRTATPSPSPTVVPGGGSGLRQEAGGMAVTVMSVRSLRDGELFYLVVDVIIENVSRSEEAPYHPLFFSLEDSDGNWYEASDFAPDPSLAAGTLARGASDRGNVAFEITSAAHGFILTYDPTALGSDYEVIQIDLGQ